MHLTIHACMDTGVYSNNCIHIQSQLCPMFLPACVTVLWLPMHVFSDPTLHEYYVVCKLELCTSYIRILLTNCGA